MISNRSIPIAGMKEVMGTSSASDDATSSQVNQRSPEERFTPGPWWIEAPIKIDGKHYGAGTCFDVVAHFNSGWQVARLTAQSPNVEANARLIAAAPTMLAALINVEAVLSIVQPRSDTAEYLAALDQVREAITKALQS